MRERRTIIIESSLYKELSEIASKVKNDSISNQLENAVRDYIAKEKGKNDEQVFSSILIPIEKKLATLEEDLLEVLFRIKLDAGIILNLLLPLSADYITTTEKETLEQVMNEIDGIYDSARRKTIKQLENKVGDNNAVC
ncbi:MAG: hypothetical protein ACM3UU_10005 [Ignavibacteriales bacterium]